MGDGEHSNMDSDDLVPSLQVSPGCGVGTMNRGSSRTDKEGI